VFYALSQPHDYRALAIRTSIEVFPRHPLSNESFTVSAVWDTGATFTAINPEIVKSRKLIFIDDAKVSGVGGGTEGKYGALAIRLPSGLFIPDKRIVACRLPPSVDMLIGMDIIALGDFCISNTDGKTLFSFVIPSLPEHIDLADEAARLE
jgi:hypothetical protein